MLHIQADWLLGLQSVTLSDQLFILLYYKFITRDFYLWKILKDLFAQTKEILYFFLFGFL